MTSTKEENDLINYGFQGPYKPLAVNYDAAVTQINYNDLEDQQAQSLAKALRVLAITAVDILIQSQANVVANINELSQIVAYLIDGAS